jgi:transcriptional regulator with XRE-family HTH domain
MSGVNQTISEGLGRYSIGEKLRTLRLRKSMGLVELGKHTGLSAALLSKLERGKLFPTLPTLLRIALVFGVGFHRRAQAKGGGHCAARGTHSSPGAPRFARSAVFL